MKIKKTPFYIIGAISLIVVLGIAALFAVWEVEYSQQQNIKSHQNNTNFSYVFSDDGAIVRVTSSPSIVLKIYRNDQSLRAGTSVLRVRVPASFTLSWQIDPKIDLSLCEMHGPAANSILDKAYLYGYDVSDRNGVSGFLVKHGGHEGSLRFDDVVLDQPGYTSPVYQGTVSFREGNNEFSISCLDGLTTVSSSGLASVWIDQ